MKISVCTTAVLWGLLSCWLVLQTHLPRAAHVPGTLELCLSRWLPDLGDWGFFLVISPLWQFFFFFFEVWVELLESSEKNLFFLNSICECKHKEEKNLMPGILAHPCRQAPAENVFSRSTDAIKSCPLDQLAATGISCQWNIWLFRCDRGSREVEFQRNAPFQKSLDAEGKHLFLVLVVSYAVKGHRLADVGKLIWLDCKYFGPRQLHCGTMLDALRKMCCQSETPSEDVLAARLTRPLAPFAVCLPLCHFQPHQSSIDVCLKWHGAAYKTVGWNMRPFVGGHVFISCVSTLAAAKILTCFFLTETFLFTSYQVWLVC